MACPLRRPARGLVALLMISTASAAWGQSRDDEIVVIGTRERAGRLRAIGKRIAHGVNAESIGLLAFRAGGAERFRDAIDQAMRTPEGTTIWYLRVIHHLAQNGEVGTLDIEGEEWGEVDFPADVDSARALTARWDAAEKAAAA